MSDDKLAQILDIPPLLPESQVKVERMDEHIEDDYEYARGNMINIIEKGNEALNGILSVADQSQHPRSYEVVATLIKTMAETNKDLMELTKKKREITGENNAPTTVNNNLFVGSTAELQKLIKQQDGSAE